MKFSNLLLFTGAAVTSFYLVKNREKIMDEAVETYDSMNSIQPSKHSKKCTSYSSTKKPFRIHFTGFGLPI